jgi:MFS family permease
VSPLVLALISAAPMFGNLSSFFWNRLASARPKISFAVTLQALTIACVLTIAVAPTTQPGVALLVGTVVLSRLLITGIITVRSVVWSLNYPRSQRARTTGQLQIITSLVTVAISSGVGPLLDSDPGAFRWVYACGGLFGLLGVIFFAQVRVPGEKRQRVLERRHSRITDGSQGFLGILRHDRNFAHYQFNQFLAGCANMLLEAPLVFLVTRELQASYTVSIAVTMVIPFTISVITLPIWARFLDRVHVTEFRARQSILWIVSQLILWFGAFTGSLLWIGISRGVLGVARGGGALAWQLGHNDFAPQDQLASYMGVHVTLTGVRGATAPFLGMLLYVGWEHFPGIGHQLFLLAALLSSASWLGYRRLHQRMAAASQSP